MQPLLKGLALAAMLGVAAGCATSATHTNATSNSTDGTAAEQAALARYTAYAGPPIDQFTWLGRFYSWEGLGRDRLVVFTTPSDAYLLKVWPTCDLRWVINLVGVSSTAGTVTAHGDTVSFNSGATGPMRCPIDEIRRIDYKRMRADMRTQKNAAAPSPGQR
jgi:hypothetical protein